MFTRSHNENNEEETNLSHDGVVILDTNVEKTQNGVNATQTRSKDKVEDIPREGRKWPQRVG
jgi:hypothetical protein